MRHLHLFHEAHHHGSKGLVHLKQVNLVNGQPRLGQRLARRRHGAGQHDGGVGTAQGRCHNARTWREAVQFARRFRANQHCGGAVHNAG